MAKMGRFTAKDFEKLQKELNSISQSEIDTFIESCAKELAARLLSLVIKRTPVGDYSDAMSYSQDTQSLEPVAKKGGTLRRGWTSKTHEEAEKGSGDGKNPRAYANSLEVIQNGSTYSIEVINPVEYASYVEYGHRQTPRRYVPAIGKRLSKSWIEGKHMLEISRQELERITPGVLKRKVEKYIRSCFKDD